MISILNQVTIAVTKHSLFYARSTELLFYVEPHALRQHKQLRVTFGVIDRKSTMIDIITVSSPAYLHTTAEWISDMVDTHDTRYQHVCEDMYE